MRLSVSGAAGIVLALAFAQRPLTAPLPATVELTDMTWVEVRSAIIQGYTTVIVPSGGIEQNGPHMILGKHDYIVRFAARRIASELGHALVAPAIPFVPEGNYEPPEGHLRFPGTIGISQQAFAQTLDGVARSLKAAGFTTICFIADHGGSVRTQAEVAGRLDEEWLGTGVRVIDVSDYYGVDAAQIEYLRAQGEGAAAIGQHAGVQDTSELMAVHPDGVDLSRVPGVSLVLEPSGVSGDPRRASAEWGSALIDIKVQAALRQIRSWSP